MNCPHCNTLININDPESTHQVNDNTEDTCCSYECSAVVTIQHLLRLDSGLTKEELDEILYNT